MIFHLLCITFVVENEKKKIIMMIDIMQSAYVNSDILKENVELVKPSLYYKIMDVMEHSLAWRGFSQALFHS